MVIEIEEAELSGRELDAAIAEHVMGWRNVGAGYLKADYGGDDPAQPDKGIQRVPSYSQSIEAAMEVVEKLLSNDGWLIETHNMLSGDRWQVAINCRTTDGYPEIGSARSSSLPEAICRAALKAVASESS